MSPKDFPQDFVWNRLFGVWTDRFGTAEASARQVAQLAADFLLLDDLVGPEGSPVARMALLLKRASDTPRQGYVIRIRRTAKGRRYRLEPGRRNTRPQRKPIMPKNRNTPKPAPPAMKAVPFDSRDGLAIAVTAQAGEILQLKAKLASLESRIALVCDAIETIVRPVIAELDGSLARTFSPEQIAAFRKAVLAETPAPPSGEPQEPTKG
ncbi:hypothetical protein GC173_17175 [bacterium]|nr:hypothetical protein [bacterium]